MDYEKKEFDGGKLMTFDELKSRYSSIERIKKGGQKIVYKVKTLDGKIFALKIIPNSTDARVLQEIEVINSINIPNIPVIVDSGIVYDDSVGENVLFIVEEFIEGVSCRDWISAGNKMSLTQAYRTMNALLEIEIELEKHKILHRDINPNNIILCPGGEIILIDFGLVKKLGGLSLTQTAALHGPFTPGYAPHEQFANMKLEQDVRTDLFQIGVTIYECCIGKNPFVEPNESIYDIMTRTMSFIPPALVLAGDNTGLFSQFVNMLMAKNQSQRPDTAHDAMRYLEAIKSSLELEV